MKPQSEKLFKYLEERNLLNASSKEIQEAKNAYRKAYKQAWHQQKKQKSKVLQIHFTEEQFKALTFRAKSMGICPTHYAQGIVIAEQEDKDLIPHKIILQKILQIIAMASIQSLRNGDKELTALIDEAEVMLTQYLIQNQ
ncbi:MAG: hypothetical protein ACOYMA_08565 [Bacteroidia bacterium]